MELCLAISPGELTRAEQKILDYINTNTDAFLFSSIGQLARRLDLSDATVSRFARHVGCTDFKELKTLVVEQTTGPAAKMAETLSQDGGFSPTAWLERQQLYLKKNRPTAGSGGIRPSSRCAGLCAANLPARKKCLLFSVQYAGLPTASAGTPCFSVALRRLRAAGGPAPGWRAGSGGHVQLF